MAFFLFPLIPSTQIPATNTTFYVAPGITRIDSLSVVNTDAAAHTVTINLVALGGSAGTANITTDAVTIQPGQTWNSPNEVGKVLNKGDFISAVASAASVLNIMAGGVLQQ